GSLSVLPSSMALAMSRASESIPLAYMGFVATAQLRTRGRSASRTQRRGCPVAGATVSGAGGTLEISAGCADAPVGGVQYSDVAEGCAVLDMPGLPGEHDEHPISAVRASERTKPVRRFAPNVGWGKRDREDGRA